MAITHAGFRKEFEIAVDGIVYGAVAVGAVEIVYEGDGIDEELVLISRELEELELDVYDQDGEQAEEHVYAQVEEYVEENFEGWI